MLLLVTGFGPFGSVRDNPSERLARKLESTGEAEALILPTSYRRAGHRVVEALAFRQPEALLLLGVAAGAEALRLERFARNQTGIASPDADGEQPPGPLVNPNGDERIETTAPIEAIQSQLVAAEVSAIISEDAGAYVCNHTYYRALEAVRLAAPPLPCLFVHVPHDEMSAGRDEEHAVPFEVQLGAVARIGRALLGSVKS